MLITIFQVQTIYKKIKKVTVIFICESPEQAWWVPVCTNNKGLKTQFKLDLCLCLHSSIHIQYEIRLLSVSHSRGMAAPTLALQAFLSCRSTPGVNDIYSDIIFHTFWPRLSRPSSSSGAGNLQICDRFNRGSGMLYMSRPSEPLAAKVLT